MTDTVLKTQLANTTVDTEEVEDYLLSVPRNYEIGKEAGQCDYALLLLRRADFIDLELRQYLAGHRKTLYHLNREIRHFMVLNETAAKVMIAHSLESTRQIILLGEWFELLGRFQTARQRIHRQFNL